MATERLQLPSFHHNVQDWLLHVQGYLANTSANDQQIFNAVVCVLPTEVAALVQSTITSPPDSNRFAALKSALLDVYRRPDHHHLQELQTITLGYRRPSIMWQQMQLINIRCNTSLPTAVLRSMFLQKLPWEEATDLTHALASRLSHPYGLQELRTSPTPWPAASSTCMGYRDYDLTYALAIRLVYLYGLQGATNLTYALASRPRLPAWVTGSYRPHLRLASHLVYLYGLQDYRPHLRPGQPPRYLYGVTGSYEPHLRPRHPPRLPAWVFEVS
ncbi:hypothetical protein GWK47_018907 [Chionoecetes opilio]|uniref:Uncharacterized protein n=1 Tax=Chionoecetes opilio TaxID=41210 RepID=A0A8J5CLJ2_CHIOP|nr:hypothetical protein GWK47_018907 [Chionoecetes opilio]